MLKLASTLILAVALAAPTIAFAGDKTNDKSSNVDKKMQSNGGKASPGTVGAMNNNPESSSFTASKSAQKKAKLK